MSDVPSNVKPLTLTTGRVIFAIAGIYVTQSLVSALSMQSLPALVRAAGGSLALAGATTLFMPALGAEVYLGAVGRALAATSW
ncbi:signal transducer [Klebsiella michiganensis]|uniref:Signal transducer n=1 Tax=Klebsiella michiganensis TaxID=1134687 RepID=A0A7H4MZD2_9ENTR|nr:signal transducer [Klebsiella michiganensis]